MADKETTILLLHGAFHPTSVWDDLIPHLHKHGYRTLAPQLCFCGSGDERPITSWRACIDQIQTILSQETSAGRDVVLANHSLGGIGGCSAVQGFTAKDSSAVPEGGKGRVVGIVQVTATTVRDAEHAHEFYAKRLGRDPSVLITPGGWTPAPPAEVSKRLFYHDLAPQEADRWAARLLATSEYLYAHTEGVYAGFKDVPTWYVRCDRDLLITPPEQDEFVAIIREMNSDTTVRRLESGHSPMLSKPAELAGIIKEAVEHCVKVASASTVS
ncbi:hypothetical protein MGN70_006144 [Eutypa lata]|nr:hypothetical protein MGN70_006144 [Eutypa lata]